MRVRPVVELMVIVSLLPGCAAPSDRTRTDRSATDRSVAASADPSSPSAPAKPGRVVEIGRVPAAGVDIGDEREHVVMLIGLDGNVFGRLHAFTLEYANGSVPGVVLVSFERSTYRLDVSRGRLVRTTRQAGDLVDQGDGEVGLRPPIGSMVDGTRAGSWLWAERSPDGRWWLAQWSGECETPSVYLARAGERPVSVTGARRVSNAVEAFALGWTDDGRALVQLLQPSCGRGFHDPGIYAFTAPGEGQLVYATRGLVFARMWGAA